MRTAVGLLAAALTSSLYVVVQFAQTPPPTAIRVILDPSAPGKPFPHFWERMIGSGRAVLTLRESWRNDLRQVKRNTGLEYVRFHGIFDDENGVVTKDQAGKVSYNFSYIDQIYDGLLENGVRPFVELSFMPTALARSQKPHAFWYKPLPNPPADYQAWGDLVAAFVRHLESRYGAEEVGRWYFEVWNEPNIDFWTGEPKQATYFELYDAAAQAVRSVDKRLLVGGPATAQAAWIPAFIQHCQKQHVPVDFVSTHVYGNDSAEDVFGTHEKIPRKDMVARSVRKVFDEVSHSAMPNLPIIWSEYNATYLNDPAVTDSSFMGPWLANTIRVVDGQTAMLSYWCLSDVFEEQGIVRKPFYGGYGIIAAASIPKAAYNVFALLHELGTTRVASSSEDALVTKTGDGRFRVALWNYAEPGQNAAPKTFQIELRGKSAGTKLVARQVNSDSGSTLEAWKAMGEPDLPTRDQQKKLREAAILQPAAPVNGTTIRLQPRTLMLLESTP